MRKGTKLLILLLAGLLVFGGLAQARKLPDGAYIKSAKIHILSGEMDRYREAEYMLDSLFLHYGPHAEGLFLMNQMMVDILEKTPDMAEKEKIVERLVAYDDSLKICCNNKDIKSKYRKGCDDFVAKADSTLVRYWREFYNLGVASLTNLKQTVEELKAASDSTSIAFFEKKRDALADTTIQAMDLAIRLDPTDFRTYVGIASVFEQQRNFDSANAWLDMGAQYAEDPANVKLQMAYNYINAGDYCKAATPLSQYCDLVPTDTTNMVNLGVCYNACQKYDEALQTYKSVLTIAPQNLDALKAVGTYFNQQARYANDSATFYRDKENAKQADFWMGERSRILDSSLYYFNEAFVAHDTSLEAAEQYGMIAYVQGQFDKAIDAYSKAVQIDSTLTDLWLSLGDSYIQLQQFSNAIRPYEVVVSHEPDNKDILERLVDLYKENKQTKKAQDAQARLDKLK